MTSKRLVNPGELNHFLQFLSEKVETTPTNTKDQSPPVSVQTVQVALSILISWTEEEVRWLWSQLTANSSAVDSIPTCLFNKLIESRLSFVSLELQKEIRHPQLQKPAVVTLMLIKHELSPSHPRSWQLRLHWASRRTVAAIAAAVCLQGRQQQWRLATQSLERYPSSYGYSLRHTTTASWPCCSFRLRQPRHLIAIHGDKVPDHTNAASDCNIPQPLDSADLLQWTPIHHPPVALKFVGVLLLKSAHSPSNVCVA